MQCKWATCLWWSLKMSKIQLGFKWKYVWLFMYVVPVLSKPPLSDLFEWRIAGFVNMCASLWSCALSLGACCFRSKNHDKFRIMMIFKWQSIVTIICNHFEKLTFFSPSILIINYAHMKSSAFNWYTNCVKVFFPAANHLILSVCHLCTLLIHAHTWKMHHYRILNPLSWRL